MKWSKMIISAYTRHKKKKKKKKKKNVSRVNFYI